jgi:Uma2 family endonuclease
MVVLSPKALPDLRLTVDEYLQADLPEGHRYELVEGIVTRSPTPGPGHDHTVNRLYQALYDFGKAHPGRFAHITSNATVPVPGKTNVREPDLALYEEWSGSATGWQGWRTIVPIWVAEVVSPDYALRDYRDKRRDYWSAGIREYWIVDPQEERVTILTRGDDDWSETVVTGREDAHSKVLAGFAVPVTRLFS